MFKFLFRYYVENWDIFEQDDFKQILHYEYYNSKEDLKQISIKLHYDCPSSKPFKFNNISRYSRFSKSNIQVLKNLS